MNTRKKHLPSPAMCVALLALFVALGGGAYAISKAPKNSVTSKSIKDKTVKTKDVSPKLVAPLAARARTVTPFNKGQASNRSVDRTVRYGQVDGAVFYATAFKAADTGGYVTLGAGESNIVSVPPFTFTQQCVDSGGALTAYASVSSDGGGGVTIFPSSGNTPAGEIAHWSNGVTQLPAKTVTDGSEGKSLGPITLGSDGTSCTFIQYAIG